MIIPADQETSWIYKADKPRLLDLQEKLRNGSRRPNLPATHGYAIRAGLVVGKLMEALEFYADEEESMAYKALELVRKELEGAQQ